MSESIMINLKMDPEVFELLERIEQKLDTLNSSTAREAFASSVLGEAGAEDARALNPFEAGEEDK